MSSIGSRRGRGADRGGFQAVAIDERAAAEDELGIPRVGAAVSPAQILRLQGNGAGSDGERAVHVGDAVVARIAGSKGCIDRRQGITLPCIASGSRSAGQGGVAQGIAPHQRTADHGHPTGQGIGITVVAALVVGLDGDGAGNNGQGTIHVADGVVAAIQTTGRDGVAACIGRTLGVAGKPQSAGECARILTIDEAAVSSGAPTPRLAVVGLACIVDGDRQGGLGNGQSPIHKGNVVVATRQPPRRQGVGSCVNGSRGTTHGERAVQRGRAIAADQASVGGAG